MRHGAENQRISSRCESYVKLKTLRNTLFSEYELLPLNIYVSKNPSIY
jgi:hypothetical protein